jgi:hypothetical protein
MILVSLAWLFVCWLALSPDKDTFLSGHQDWSTSTCMVGPKPPYYGAQEKHPELQALISALSAGPIAGKKNALFSPLSWNDNMKHFCTLSRSSCVIIF